MGPAGVSRGGRAGPGACLGVGRLGFWFFLILITKNKWRSWWPSVLDQNPEGAAWVQIPPLPQGSAGRPPPLLRAPAWLPKASCWLRLCPVRSLGNGLVVFESVLSISKTTKKALRRNCYFSVSVLQLLQMGLLLVGRLKSDCQRI